MILSGIEYIGVLVLELRAIGNEVELIRYRYGNVLSHSSLVLITLFIGV